MPLMPIDACTYFEDFILNFNGFVLFFFWSEKVRIFPQGRWRHDCWNISEQQTIYWSKAAPHSTSPRGCTLHQPLTHLLENHTFAPHQTPCTSRQPLRYDERPSCSLMYCSLYTSTAWYCRYILTDAPQRRHVHEMLHSFLPVAPK